MDMKALENEYRQLHAESGKLVEKSGSEKLTAEELEQKDKLFSRMDQIKVAVEDHKRHASLAFSAGEVEQDEPKGKVEFDRVIEGKPEAYDTELLRRDINHYLRTGEVTPELFTITGSTQSGAFIPKTVLPPQVVRQNNNAFRKAIGLRGLTPLETTTTNTISLPVYDDAITGATLTESATSATDADATTSGSITLGNNLYQAKNQWFSNTAILANEFDVLAYIGPPLFKRLDKAMESAWTTTLTGLSAISTTTTASGSTITYSELLAWEHGLPVAYRDDAVFIVSDSLYQVLRGLVDTNNRPVMDNDPQNIFQKSIHGMPVVVSSFLDAFLTSAQYSSSSSGGGTVQKKLGALVSAECIKIRDVVPQRFVRYVNVPAYPDQTGFNVFANGDCQFVTSGVALLKSH